MRFRSRFSSVGEFAYLFLVGADDYRRLSVHALILSGVFVPSGHDVNWKLTFYDFLAQT